MLLSFEMANVGDLVFDMAGTSLTSRKAQGTSVLRESNEHGKRGNGGSPGTWEVLSSPRLIGRRGCPNLQTPGPGTLRLGPVGAKRRCDGGTAKRRKRSALIVPTQQENSSREAAVEGSRTSSRGPDGRKHGQVSNVIPMSRQRYRIARGNSTGSESTT